MSLSSGNLPRTRPLPPVEWLHDKHCYAQAVISAVQNIRDNPNVSSLDFALDVQESGLRDVARGYLNDGLQTCTCIPSMTCGQAPWLCSPGQPHTADCDPVIHLHTPTGRIYCGADRPALTERMTAYRSVATCERCLATLSS
jgi:hypothetical protein